MSDWMKSVLEGLGYWGVAALTFAENLFPPIPSEVIMPLVGFMSTKGDLQVAWAIIAGSAGSLIGTSIYYYAGMSIQESTLRRWIRDHGQWLALGVDDLEKAQDWFSRHGRWALLICRFVPGVRTLISLPAGINRTPAPVYLAWSTVGIIVWTTALTYVGVALGKNFDRVANYTRPISWAVTAVIVGAIAIFVYRRRRSQD
jgi:membrane protein DedA with SNARE-associated domain